MMVARRRRNLGRGLAVLMLALLAGVANAWAHAGDLDPGFSGNGRLTFPLAPKSDSDYGSGLVVDGSGKLLVAGYTVDPTSHRQIFGVARLHANGSLDRTFSHDGRQAVRGANTDPDPAAIAVAPNGDIVLAAFTKKGPKGEHSGFTVSRLTPRGRLDRSFSGDGQRHVPVGRIGAFWEQVGVAVDRRGRVVAAGTTHHHAVVVRLNADGTPDRTFGHRGRARLRMDRGEQQGYAQAVAIQPDGKIVIAGGTSTLRHYYLAVARLTAGGDLDPTFSGDGRTSTRFDGDADGSSVAIQRDGKIVVAGSSEKYGSGQTRFAVARFDPDGILDPAFSSDGTARTSFPGKSAAWANALAVQRGGKIVLTGTAEKGQIGPLSIATARLDSDGSLDRSFAGDGRAVANFGHGTFAFAGAAGVVVERGRVVVAGDAYVGSGLSAPDRIALVAYKAR
jgi:uncharacterized delta-60 repeat protein